MRFAAACILALLLPAPCALAIDESVPTAESLAALEQRALTAPPKDQCFLYAEVVHMATELASRQYIAGNQAQAALTVDAIQKYASKIHLGVADDSKRLKNAEILVRHTAFRLKDLIAGVSIDDRPQLEATLKQLDQVQAEMLVQIFKH